MPRLKTYRVAVREIYRKVITVRANSEKDAHRRAWDGWLNGEIILTEDDFEGEDFYVMPRDGNEPEEKKPAGDSVIQGYGVDEPDVLRKGTAKNGKK